MIFSIFFTIFVCFIDPNFYGSIIILYFSFHILLLFAPTGPPGCGKTLIARQIGKILNAREPKIINGPEVGCPCLT